MIFAILTLLSALSLAATAGWFSIVGFMAIYAGAPIPALIMGAVTEAAKLVTVSWIYRNWEYSDWKLKLPLIYFTIALMTATSIGVFGFLSKAHLEQGSGTIDNSAKIEQLNYQINREKSLIADNEKVIGQLDATVNSFLGKDRTDRSLTVRKSQAPQRKQLRDENDAAQKRIDTLSAEKFTLESEVRKMQLEVGPIRYIAELFYGVEENATKNIEAAVRIFTLLIVSTLDPLAVILLIAANHTLMRLKNEKIEKNTSTEENSEVDREGKDTVDDEIRKELEEIAPSTSKVGIHEGKDADKEEGEISIPLQGTSLEVLDEKTKDVKDDTHSDVHSVRVISPGPAIKVKDHVDDTTNTIAEDASSSIGKEALPQVAPLIIRQPALSRIGKEEVPIATRNNSDDPLFRELRGSGKDYFIPKKVDEMARPQNNDTSKEKTYKYPKALSWLTEFNKAKNG